MEEYEEDKVEEGEIDKERKVVHSSKNAEIRGAFRFHSVGQGLFYSGILKQDFGLTHRVFTFVYDCGTSSSKTFLNREIDDFKLLLPKVDGKKHLDLLIISHLHDDHVNGLERLLSDVIVDTVVMSYVDDGLRVLAQLESEDDSNFLRQFYADPVDWFRHNGVRRVCLLGADERKYNNPQNKGNYWIENNRGIQISPEGIRGIENKDNIETIYLKHNVQMCATGFFWDFFFENLCAVPDMEKIYRQTVEDFKRDHLVTLEQILQSRRLTRELREKINSVIPEENAINRSSVVLLHNPMEADSYINCGSPCMNMWHVSTKGKTLLTGDVCVRNNEHLKIVDRLVPYENDGILIMQYPHHGAKCSHLDYFSRTCPEYIVVSYGICNHFGHPDMELVKKAGACVHVNERNGFDYLVYTLRRLKQR